MCVDNPGIAHIVGGDDLTVGYYQPPAVVERHCRPDFTGYRSLVAPGKSKKCLVMGSDRRFDGQLRIGHTLFCTAGRLFIGRLNSPVFKEPHLADSDPGDVNRYRGGHLSDAPAGYRGAFY